MGPIICLLLVAVSFGKRHITPEELRGKARSLEVSKSWSEAAKTWEQLAEQNPTDPHYPLNAANDQYNAKEYALAIPNFEKADELGVSYKWDMPYSEACCFALLGEKARALKCLGTAMDLGFRDLGQVQTDADLASLHTDQRFIELAATTDVSKMDRVAGYRYDLWLLNRELRRLHYSPYLRHPKGQFDKFVSGLQKDIPKLNDTQIAVRFKELAAMTGDGHTHITTPFELPTAKMGLPVGFMTFKEGLFVIKSDANHADLLGRQVLAIGGHKIDELQRAVVPLCSYDNQMWITAREPEFYRMPALLNGLGLIPDPSRTTLTVRDKAGKVSDVALEGNTNQNDPGWKLARDLSEVPAPLTFRHRDKNYWFELLPDSKTVFFQYNAVADMQDEPISKFSERLFKFIGDNQVDRLIVDMRWNGGGNNFLNKPLLEGLVKSRVNVPGKLFVIVGRFTFSAAMCGATQIERYTHAIFAGEPTGSAPNFIGESIPIKLPYSHMQGTVSDLYWQNSVAMDHRIWISPTIYAPPSFADYAENRDPVLDLILAYKAPEGKG